MTPELVLMDMDGTVYSADSMIEGADTAIEWIREEGIDLMFLTNYAGRRRDNYSEKLEKMGIDASTDEIVTSGWITAKYVAREFPEATVFVIGEPELVQELGDQGVDIQDACDKPDVLVVSNKHDLSYEDLREVLQNLADDTEIIGTNPDETIPGESGEIPGAGTVIQAVETMTGKEAEIIGKPSDNAVETVMEVRDVAPEECMMVGDRLNTDILMGKRNGMETVLVLSGVTERTELEESDIEPDNIIGSIKEIHEILDT